MYFLWKIEEERNSILKKNFLWDFRKDLFLRVTKVVIFREDLILRIAHFEIFRVDLISRILSKFAKTAKFNRRKN